MQSWNSVEEQETSILYGRDEDIAHICTSDLTQINKFDKLCAAAVTEWECVNELWEDGKIVFKEYVVPKSLLSYRKAKAKRELTEEQKQVARNNMARLRADGKL